MVRVEQVLLDEEVPETEGLGALGETSNRSSVDVGAELRQGESHAHVDDPLG
jgi:hypothetical protein